MRLIVDCQWTFSSILRPSHIMHKHNERRRHRHRHRHTHRHCACSKYARVRAHVCGQRAVHPHHTHTHMCTQWDAHVHAHAREHPAHLHTELTRQLIKDTAHAPSFAALRHVYTPTDQGHSTRTLVCCAACTSASVPACPAKNFAPLGPRAAFLSVRLSVPRGPTGLLGPRADKLSVCLIVTLNGPHRPFPTYLRALQIFLHICLPLLCKFALQYFVCTAIAYVADFAIKECAICMRCNTCKICKSAYNCVQFACKFGLRMCMLAFPASTLQICTAIAYVADFPIKESQSACAATPARFANRLTIAIVCKY